MIIKTCTCVEGLIKLWEYVCIKVKNNMLLGVWTKSNTIEWCHKYACIATSVGLIFKLDYLWILCCVILISCRKKFAKVAIGCVAHNVLYHNVTYYVHTAILMHIILLSFV